jgi:hypothetical protein
LGAKIVATTGGTMLREKPPILTEVDFSKWCSEQECDLREGCSANLRDNLVYCDIEAQRDADVVWFRAEIGKLGVMNLKEWLTYLGIYKEDLEYQEAMRPLYLQTERYLQAQLQYIKDKVRMME